MAYVVKTRLKHDGKRYLPGEASPKMSKEEEIRLLDLGVIANGAITVEEKRTSENSSTEKKNELKPITEMSGKELDAYGTEIGVDTTKKSAKADKIQLIQVREYELTIETGKLDIGQDEVDKIEAMTDEELVSYAEEIGVENLDADESLEAKRAAIYWQLGADALAEDSETEASPEDTSNLDGVDPALLGTN